MLMIKAGRTFCVMPKSTCHTSPRLGTPSVLLLIQRAECGRSERPKILIRQIVRNRDALNDGVAQLAALGFGEPLNLPENMSNCLCHDSRIRDVRMPSKRTTRLARLANAEKEKGSTHILWRFGLDAISLLTELGRRAALHGPVKTHIGRVRCSEMQMGGYGFYREGRLATQPHGDGHLVRVVLPSAD